MVDYLNYGLIPDGNEACSVREFLDIYLSIRGFTIVWPQERVATHFEDNIDERQIIIKVHRGAGKSLIIAALKTYILAHNQNVSNITVSANKIVAEKNLEAVKWAVDTHPYCGHLRDILATDRKAWSSRMLWFPNSTSYEPNLYFTTVDAQKSTGARADIVWFDDIIDQKTVMSQTKTFNLHHAVNDWMVAAHKQRVWIYTTWGGTDSEYIRIEKQTKKKCILTIPWDDSMFDTCPGRYTKEWIEDIKSMGEAFVRSQLYLEYVDESFGGLDPNMMHVYKDKFTHRDDPNFGQKYEAVIGDVKLVDIVAAWDPALGRRDGDNSAFTVIGTDGKKYYQERLVLLPEVGGPDDKLPGYKKQFSVILPILDYYRINTLVVEESGLNQMATDFAEYAKKHNSSVSVVGVRQKENKERRIQYNFGLPLTAGRIYCSTNIKPDTMSQFRREILAFPTVKSEKDDCLDVTSMAIEALGNPDIDTLALPPELKSLQRQNYKKL